MFREIREIKTTEYINDKKEEKKGYTEIKPEKKIDTKEAEAFILGLFERN